MWNNFEFHLSCVTLSSPVGSYLYLSHLGLDWWRQQSPVVNLTSRGFVGKHPAIVNLRERNLLFT